MNENIDLTKILKDCPEGTEFYHSVYDRVWFCCIDLDCSYPIRLSLSKEVSDNTGVTSKGNLSKHYNGECILFPSKEQRDWSKFTAPWYKKEKFDPNTLYPFVKVLVRDSNLQIWKCNVFSHIKRCTMEQRELVYYSCIYDNWNMCIPYNDDTKHLVGTTDEAPEYYRYWAE